MRIHMEIHVEIYMGTPMVIPTEILWEWDGNGNGNSPPTATLEIPNNYVIGNYQIMFVILYLIYFYQPLFVDFFTLFFSEKLLKTVLEMTNKKLNAYLAAHPEQSINRYL